MLERGLFHEAVRFFFIPVFLALTGDKWNIRLSSFFLGVDLVAVVLAGPYVFGPARADFWGAISGFSGNYMRSGWTGLLAQPELRHALIFEWGAAVLAFYGAAVGLCLIGGFLGIHQEGFKAALGRGRALALWVAGALLACSVSGKFFSYYFCSLLAPLALGCALAVSALQRMWGQKAVAMLVVGCLSLSLLGLWSLEGAFWPAAPSLKSPLADFFRQADKVAGATLKEAARPGDRLLAWSTSGQLYVYSELGMAALRAPFIPYEYVLGGEMVVFEKRFEQNPPRFIVDGDLPDTPMPGWMTLALKKDYRELILPDTARPNRLFERL